MSLPGNYAIIDNFVNGVRLKSDKYLDGFNPATGEVFLKIVDSGLSEAKEAINSAEKAFDSWSKTDINLRSKILLKIADLIEDRLDEFARAESLDQGKPAWLAKTLDIPRVIHNFRIFATAALHKRDRCHYMENQSAFSYTSKHPVGVALLISPWNLPLYLLTFKLAPALITGNTVVCKPSEFTSLTASMLCDVCNLAGLPPGVLNMVFGTGQKVGSHLVSDPRIKIVSFTGSTATAEKIRLASVTQNKKLSLELGGKNAAIVFEDCNLEKCLMTMLRSCFLNQGEICLCISRIFVQSGIYETFVKRFVEETKKIKVGDPNDDSNFMGALVSKEHYQKVTDYVQLARKEKISVLCGDEQLTLPGSHINGYFVRPHILTGMKDDSQLMQEEIFGPVVCVTSFDDELEVIKRANNSSYGLCATLWSENIHKVHRIARQLQVGTVWANCWMVRDLHVPFGGVKNSGVGKEGVVQSLNFFTETKTTCIQMNPLDQDS
ncbi:hypothetical protein HELRODRAFT_102275 [Helobdella robusta]|uniref:Aldehyde dehydrogenase domain-containing protein n=1 Tax=Helobdella robusta TaxID=6412 RepID=T1ED92_HELRO|nr:hypothetical protein HELRODRAFT_102275 [Helobdella robusta]ESN96808.1 hypothetical protein HELRODRAFT_102275 [Helobdella robusta]